MNPARFIHHLLHLTVPRSSNNYKARILHPSAVTVFLLAIIFLQTVMSLAGEAGWKILGYASQISPQEVIRMTNEKRKESGLGMLSENVSLNQAAMAKAQDMIADDYWAHVAPDGTEPWAFFSNSGYKYKYAGENLARDFTNPKAAVDAWMASPSHRENMLSDRYREIGVAVIDGKLGDQETTLIVQLFGTKSDAIPVVPVASAREDTTIPEASPVPEEKEVPVVEEKFEEPKLTIATTFAAGNEVIADKNSVKISPFAVTKTVSLGIVGIFLIVMVVDAAVVARRQVTRIAGRAFAHISFMGMILAIILIAKAGEIF